MRRIPIFITYCASLHFYWAVVIGWRPEAVGSTPVAALLGVFHAPPILALVLLLASVAAIVAWMCPLPWSLLLLFPQQSLLIISAIGACTAMITGTFADGVARPRAFISVDQIHIVFAAIAHGVAVVRDQTR